MFTVSINALIGPMAKKLAEVGSASSLEKSAEGWEFKSIWSRAFSSLFLPLAQKVQTFYQVPSNQESILRLGTFWLC